jgi:hypothetical protein
LARSAKAPYTATSNTQARLAISWLQAIIEYGDGVSTQSRRYLKVVAATH